ncbi:MAG: hypothetical protein J5737_04165 [Bacteroidales bacterium]|nr:hypothetical protein [Bacteroidales bacterium]
MNKHWLIGISLFVPALFSCVSEKEDLTPGQGREMTITVGFETPEAPDASTKTFVYNGTQVRWSSNAVDKVIYVFDTKGVKNTFTSTTTNAGSTRSFSGTVSEGADVRLILWSGKTQENDSSELTVSSSSGNESTGAGYDPIGQGGTIVFNTKAGSSSGRAVLSGPSLAVVNPQNVDYANSFATDANISVMRPGDGKLKSVFGFMKYTIPAGVDGSATIKSITISADEDLAGLVEVDCSVAEPTAEIVSGGSKSLTVNTGWTTKEGGYYEPGTLYAVLPAGTYHNMKITITPFAGSSRTRDAATSTPITISCKGDVIIKRGCFSSLGTLPYISPSQDEQALLSSGFFKRVIDDSGVTSYLVRSDVLPRSGSSGGYWANSQSVYFSGCEMTNDERFLIVMVSDNEFTPEYHNPAKNARILDLKNKKIYNFYADAGCYPYVDPETDKLYYCRWNGSTAKFYRRDLLDNPANEIYMNDFPQALLPTNGGRSQHRPLSHVTLTTDRQSVFIDTWIDDTFYWGLMNLYTGAWDEWGRSKTTNITHGQINPRHDDEALCAIDGGWKDSSGTTQSVGYDENGYYRRMQLVKKGSMQTIPPDPEKNNASHEGWAADGDHVYFCSAGIHVRNIRTGEYRLVLRTNPGVTQATHCNPSSDMKYWTYDDNSPDYYRGCRWKVSFLNGQTGKQVFIHSHLPAIATASQPSYLHPDPHPHFVCNDKYIICSAGQDDGNLHLSITPVSQLITLTQ